MKIGNLLFLFTIGLYVVASITDNTLLFGLATVTIILSLLFK